MCVCLALPPSFIDTRILGVVPAMDMTGSERIAAPRERVYEALNDPEILKAAIPGCEAIAKTSDTEMTATVVTKVGPVKAKFQGVVTLSDLDRPNGYTISGEGRGGAAGFAKGGARVRLEVDGAQTILHYEVKADVGGKLAQLGSRLIDGTARKLSGEFFARFAALVAEPQAEAASAPAAAPAAAATAATSGAADAAVRSGGSGIVWVGGLLIALALLAGFILISR
jgi:uncharacterized protein